MKQPAQAKTLDSFCKSESILQTKIALMTFYNRRYSDWTDKFILLIEYFQLISQSLIFHASASNNATSASSSFSNTVVYFLKLVNPSYLMPLRVHNSLSSTILLIVLVSMILKYLLLLYIVLIAYWGSQGNKMLLTLWRGVFKTQSRIQCFLITSFWTAVIMGCSEGTFQVKGLDKPVIIGLCCVLMLIEYLLSFYIEIDFDYALPTKNFLAAKSCVTQAVTLLQKLVLQIVAVAFQFNSEAGVWVFSILNLGFIAIKSYQYHDKLPLYHIKALLFQNKLYSVVLSLNIACFAQTFLFAVDYHPADITFTLIVWFALALLIVKVSHEILIKRIANMLNMKFANSSPELLVQRVTAIKELERYTKLPSEKNAKYDLSYLLNALVSVNRKDIFGIDEIALFELPPDELFIQYLTNLSLKFPTNSFVKLHLARACLRNPRFYVKSIKVIAELVQKRWSRSYFSASLLINDAEKTILSMGHNSESSLDLLEYMESKSFVLKIVMGMLEQADLKTQICNNILGDTANIGHIFNHAQEVDNYKEHISKKIKLLTQRVPDSYIEPFLLAAGYYLILDYSPEKYQKYIDVYIQKKVKQGKHFESKTLTEDNLYQINNILLMLSGEKANYGQIAFCSGSIVTVCGGKIEGYQGKHVSTLFTPSFQAYFYDVFRRIFAEEETLPDKIQRAFVYHKNGYIVEVEVYFKIHPNLSQGLYVSMIIRPTNSSKEYLLVKEDGSIEGATQGITDDLSLDKSVQSSPNVKLLSEELWNINQAFNIVARKDKDLESKEYHKALKVSQAYTSEAQEIRLMSAEGKNKTSHYGCNVSVISCGSTCLKVLELVKLNTSEKRFDFIEEDSNANELDVDENIQSKEMTTEWRGQTEFNEMMSPRALSTRRLLISKSEKTTLTNTNVGVVTEIRPSDGVDNNYKLHHQVGENESQLKFANSTHALDGSTSRATNRAFLNATKINFEARSFRAICVMFYGVILFTFLSQIVLKIISDNTMESLRVKKTMLSLSQLRTYKMLFIVINCRRGVNNIIDPNIANGVTFSGMVTVVNNLEPHKIAVEDYNKRILENTYLLSDDIKRDFFSRDIRVYGSYVDSNDRSYYKDMTNFELVDDVIDAIQKLNGIKGDPDLLKGQTAYNLFNFILLNVMNDYLYKNQEITDLFMDSVEKGKNYVQLALNFCLIITPLFLIGIVIMLTAIIWRQYHMEKKHMTAFVRLKPRSVKGLLERLTTFKKKLVDRDTAKIHEWLESINNRDTVTQNEQQQESNYHKHHDVQVINCSGTRIRYFGYVLKVAFYILILIGVMLWNYASSQKSMNVIYRRQGQLEFLYHLSVVVSVTYCAIHETFGSNNTNLIMHKKSKTALVDALADVRLMRNQLVEVLQEEDGTYDPVVEDMAFRYKDCEPYDFIVPNINYCTFIINHGGSANLNNLLSAAIARAQVKIEDYNTCDKTNISTLLVCRYRNVDYLMPPFALGAIEAQKIGDVIDVYLERSIADAQNQRNTFLAVFSVSLAIVSALIWLQVLRKVRDLQNDFKKVLQVFPPQLIFSSFLLKKFLRRKKSLE